ncbi:hypothetical protein EMIHUDRAFT_256056, partial [Emiliania huxleyi CCMP1516]
TTAGPPAPVPVPGWQELLASPDADSLLNALSGYALTEPQQAGSPLAVGLPNLEKLASRDMQSSKRFLDAAGLREAAREAGLSNPEIKVWVWLIIYAAPIPDPPPRPERAQLLGDVRRAVLALVVALRAGAVAPPADANGDRPVPRTLLTVVAWAMRAAREREPPPSAPPSPPACEADAGARRQGAAEETTRA